MSACNASDYFDCEDAKKLLGGKMNGELATEVERTGYAVGHLAKSFSQGVSEGFSLSVILIPIAICIMIMVHLSKKKPSQEACEEDIEGNVKEVKKEDIEIHAGDITGPFRKIGLIEAQVGAKTLFSEAPTIEDVNSKLREVALKKGANAVINVNYNRGVSSASWKALTATGTAVFLESDETKCPFCAEMIKREAVKCKHCGSSLVKS